MPPERRKPNYQSQDVWSRTTTMNGYSVDELRSVLQKSIRRGWVEEAALAAHELFFTSPETEEVLWRRLEIIATEDVGLGLPTAPAIIEAMNQQRQRMQDRDDRWIYCAHAVRLLASSPKDNMSMELASGRAKWLPEASEKWKCRISCSICTRAKASRWAATKHTGGTRARASKIASPATTQSGETICAS